jgi:hypothetical protein
MKIQNISGYGVKEIAIVRYNEQCGRPVLKVVFQPNNGLDIQHICWFIKKKKIRPVTKQQRTKN